MRLLLGSARPDAGSVSVFGADPYLGDSQARVGAMLQVGRVPETLKVREHIDLFSSYYPNPLPLEETLTIAGLNDIKDRRLRRTLGRAEAARAVRASRSAAIPTCCSSTSRRSASTWKRAA